MYGCMYVCIYIYIYIYVYRSLPIIQPDIDIMPHHAPSILLRSISFGFIQLKHTEATEACQKVKADTTSVAECCPSLGFVGRSAKARADPSKELGVQHDFLQNAATSTVALWYVDTSKIT